MYILHNVTLQYIPIHTHTEQVCTAVDSPFHGAREVEVLPGDRGATPYRELLGREVCVVGEWQDFSNAMCLLSSKKSLVFPAVYGVFHIIFHASARML